MGMTHIAITVLRRSTLVMSSSCGRICSRTCTGMSMPYHTYHERGRETDPSYNLSPRTLLNCILIHSVSNAPPREEENFIFPITIHPDVSG